MTPRDSVNATREAEVEDPEDYWIVAQEEQSLGDLLNFCSKAFQIDVHYDPSKLQDRVRLRVTRMMRGRELWDIANQELAQRGLTTVQLAGQDFLSVVELSKAKSLARVEAPDLEGAWAGFVRVLVTPRHVKPEALRETVSLVLSSEQGSISVAKDTGSILISDLYPRVEQAIELIGLLDRSANEVVVNEMPLAHMSPVALVALIERVATTQNQVSGEPLRGKVLTNPGKRSVLIIAPVEELGTWLEWVRRFDQAEIQTTRNYVPRRFGVAATASLIEQILEAELADDLHLQWEIVKDALTGTLVVTAPPRIHERIEDLFRRLEGAEPAPRSPIRSFPVKNRSAVELLDLLQGLLDAGALQTGVIRGQGSESEAGEEADAEIQGPTAPISELSRNPSVSSSDRRLQVTVTADEGTNRLVAIGEPRMLEQLDLLIETLDVPHSQVLVEALVVSLTESEMLDLAVELQRITQEGDVQVRLASLFGLGSPEPGALAIPAAGGTGGSAVLLEPGEFSAVVSALESLNEGRTLTIPKVLVNNNQQASLDAVLQTPFTSTNASTTVATTSFGGTQDAGTSIEVTPYIAEGDRLVIDYTVSISSFVGDSSDPNLPPPRQENRLQSVVTVPDGYIVVVGGLEIETETEAASQVPFLGRIPILGSLFRSQSRARTKSRFFVFVRCNVMRGTAFEELKYVSRELAGEVGLDEGLPVLEPRIIR